VPVDVATYLMNESSIGSIKSNRDRFPWSIGRIRLANPCVYPASDPRREKGAAGDSTVSYQPRINPRGRFQHRQPRQNPRARRPWCPASFRFGRSHHSMPTPEAASARLRRQSRLLEKAHWYASEMLSVPRRRRRMPGPNYIGRRRRAIDRARDARPDEPQQRRRQEPRSLSRRDRKQRRDGPGRDARAGQPGGRETARGATCPRDAGRDPRRDRPDRDAVSRQGNGRARQPGAPARAR